MKPMQQLFPWRDFWIKMLCCLFLSHGSWAGDSFEGKMIQGIDVDCLLAHWKAECPAQMVEVTRQGILFSLREADGQSAGLFRLGVFGNAETAKKIFGELTCTAISPVVFPCTNDSVAAAAGGAKILEQEEVWGCGECLAAWRNSGAELTRICFLRGNVVVDLMGPSPEVLRKRAWTMDGILQSDEGCVRKGESVSVPLWDEEKCLDWLAQGMHTQTEDGFASLSTTAFAGQEVCFAGRECVMAEPLVWNSAWLDDAGKKGSAMTPEQLEMREIRTRDAIAVLVDERTTAVERSKAVMSLGQSEDVSVVPLLIDELENSTDLTVKQNAIWALEKLRDCRAVPALMGILEKTLTGNLQDSGDPEAVIRTTAVYALGQIGDQRAIKTLTDVAHSTREYPSVQESAWAALRAIEAHHVSFDAGEKEEKGR